VLNLDACEIPDPTETWLDIPGYKNYYQVSDRGHIKSLSRWEKGLRTKRIQEKILKSIVSTKGYLQVGLYKNNSMTIYQVHRLVLLTFQGDCPEGLQVNHIDGNRKNNNLENLEYVTPSENLLHSFNILGRKGFGIGSCGESHGSSKLTDQEVKKIRSKYSKETVTRRELAGKYGVSVSTITQIISRKLWKHIK